MTLSKGELAEKLGYTFPSGRVNNRQLRKALVNKNLLGLLGIDESEIIAMHKARFTVQQTTILKNHFNLK
jgi:hypothetical protein